MKEFFDVIFTAWHERTRPVFWGLYAGSLIAVNHKLLLILLLNDSPIMDRYDLMVQEALWWPWAYGLPLFILLVIVPLTPHLDYLIAKVRESTTHKLIMHKIESKIKREEEKQELYEKRQRSASAQAEAAKAEVAALEQETMADRAKIARQEVGASLFGNSNEPWRSMDPITVYKTGIYKLFNSNDSDLDPRTFLQILYESASFYDVYKRLISLSRSSQLNHYLPRNLGVEAHAGEGDLYMLNEMNYLRQSMGLDPLSMNGYINESPE